MAAVSLRANRVGKRETQSRRTAPWQLNRERGLRALWLGLAVLLLVPAWGQSLTVRLEAKPSQIPADGASTSTIIATVRDSDGRGAPDGTLVIFSTTRGRLSRQIGGDQLETVLQVPTQAGRAQVILVSEAEEVTADVQARLQDGNDVSVVQVRFGSGSSPGSSGERTATIRARYLRYNPEDQLIEGIGEAVWNYRGLTILARRLQYNLNQQLVRASGLDNGVEVRRARLTLLGLVLSPWGMALFFLLSGARSVFALRRRTRLW